MSKRSRRPAFRQIGILLCTLLTPILLIATVFIAFNPARASSHREAPLISKDPFADNTDTYAFIPEGVTDRIVLVANWIPFEGPEGGPNYYEWDDSARYNIYVDNNGDATADITYTLSSHVTVGNPDTFLYNVGPITSLSDPNWNRKQTYDVIEARGSSTAPLALNVTAPPVNIGSKSTPNYIQLANQAIHTYTDPGNGDVIKVFAGQRDDPFWVDLQVFDLLTLRGQQPPVGYTNGNNIPIDSLSGYNVHSLILELPISRLVQGGEPVIGVWAAASRSTMPVLQNSNQPAAGPFTQISRLGMPLVNEVVIPVGLKDAFNTLKPSQDLSVYNLLQKSVEDPEIGNLLCGLYGVALPGDSDHDCSTEFTSGTPRSGRGDIFDIFLQGMVLANPYTITTASGPMQLPAGFNVNRPASVQPSEMIRINTAISGDLCSPTPSRLGVLGGDACGFPNGRRLTDDVVDIELLAVAGAAYPVLDGRDTGFSFNAGLIPVLSDNVNQNDVAFLNNFPYVATAQSGQEHVHQNPLAAYFFPLINKAQSAVSQSPAAQVTLGSAGLALVAGLLMLRRRKQEE